MNILIITTCYPPDTAIAAVRPYMLAKHLKKYGHSVTVLRSGLLQQSADRFFSGHEGIRVITYLGENSPSVRFENGQADFTQNAASNGESRIAFMPPALRKVFAKTYHTLVAPYDFYCWYKKAHWQKRFDPMKKAMDNLKGEHFDVVFSTYGDIENIWGGEYAAKLFGAKWFQDFRDPIEPHSPNWFGLPFLKKIQRNAVRNADFCTAVSDDLAMYLSNQAGGSPVHTLYNGYEPTAAGGSSAVPASGELSFCYTGQLYGGMRDFSPMLKAIRKLADEGKVSLDRIRIHYAGRDFSFLENQAKACGVSGIVVDHGYVSRKEAADMQAGSDIYLVLSWNTKKEKGVLTGKLYEGIRANKPILALVSGNVPHSELELINNKYHYGFCYENCREKEQFSALCDYLEGVYSEKITTGTISYTPDPALAVDFRYDTLAKRLEEMCLSLLQRG